MKRVCIGEGTFIPKGENEGYIRYWRYNSKQGESEEMGFQMTKNSEDVWKVCFMPIQ